MTRAFTKCGYGDHSTSGQVDGRWLRGGQTIKIFIAPPVHHVMKTALFLGAGASAFIQYPTARGLMELLRNRVQNGEAGGMGEIINHIIEGYDDIEKLYDGIDRLLNMRHDADHDIPNIGPIIHTLYDKNSSFKATLDELKGLKSVINDILLESFKFNTSNIESVVRMYDMIRKSIKGDESDGLQIFTTNYDTVIEEYAREIGFESVNGFQYRESKDNVWVGRWDTRTHRKPLYLTKLHGSVDWYEKNEKIWEADDVRQRPAGSSVMIAPTEGPKDYSRKPFPELQRHFEDEIAKVDVLLVIGFSYRDEYVVDVIKKNLDRGMNLISVSPTSMQDIKLVDTEVPKPILTFTGSSFSAIDYRIVLINEKLETSDHMYTSLYDAFYYVEHSKMT